MATQRCRSELVIGVSPFGEPNARLVGSVCRGGGLGVLDLGTGESQAGQARIALELVQRWAPGSFGVRVAAGCTLRPGDLPAEVDTVLLGAGSPWQMANLPGRYRVLVEITGVEQALRAARAGAAGLVARGNEAGGRVGELGSFALLQRLLAEPGLDLPVWTCGGIGLRTAVAAVIGGAAGVVLDSQLALLAESELPDEVCSAIAAMDGSETVVLAGHRVLAQRGRGSARSLPIGQDAWLAKRFAERFGTAGRVVRAVRESILDTLRDEDMTDVLGAGAALSTALGTLLPIAQGPMTRVSDQPGFAAVVAEHGALPFVALALANRDQTRALLEQTRTALGKRPWGVGVLGFAPEQTRAAQLEVIREVRPSCAVIAGGRPSQAKILEDVGISAFLHVPSPGLLEQFLEAGARKFIFEGAECGGHIGPRSSFALWEAQLTVLTDYLDAHITEETQEVAGQIQVLFAGGIHDTRSAAMVAAMAAPLARRGAGVGVLMGTAYLFTEEAVGCGAIEPLFQRQVVAAERTDLLETAPGHVTRCLASPFTENFQLIRADLGGRGLPDRQVWEELELLNQGRLRIASKGVQRSGADLISVSEDQQLAEGLFMAGQVAVLRHTTTTIAALHAAVSDRAANYLTRRTEQLRTRLGTPTAEERAETAPPPLDVAIVGMACMFPDAPDLESFWANVVAGANAVTEVPAERWDAEVYYSPEATGATAGALTPSKWGGFLPRIPFDPLRYGIPPASLTSIEPVQLLALEAARRALADAGYSHRTFDRSRTAVVFGAKAGGDLSQAMTVRSLLPGYLTEVPEELAAQLPPMTKDSYPGVLANVIAGRIANRLDLGGANYTVDAACASSLAALDVACKELTGGTSDLVLCGGGDLNNGVNDYLLLSVVHALSPTGQCRAFDASADGLTPGEGIACVALKRLADAERDGDRVYAVIKGVGSASDGRSRSLTAPRPEGQRTALERAYRNAGISPAQVGLIEAHGTGTVVGDRTELRTLTELFTESGAAPGSCTLGSVKSQIGHTKCTAGLAGLIKAVLAVHTGIRPPTLHVSEPNKEWQAASSPFAFSPLACPWVAPPAERVAGVSAFGFGGTNFHVVVQGYDGTTAPRHGLDQWPAELLTFHGADHPAACSTIARLIELTRVNDDAGRPWRLRDLARTASRWADRSHEPVQVAIVAEDLDDLADLLGRAVAGKHDVARGLFLAGLGEPGEVAVLFPGQGSQRPGMLAELFVTFPELGHVLQRGRRWADALFPPAAFGPDDRQRQEQRLRDTRVAQPALGIAGLAVHQLLTRLGVEVGMLAGHSYGELVALCAAGAFDAAALLELSEARAEAILAAAGDDPGTMAAVAASGAQVERVLHAADLADQVVVANHNSPRQVVISGPTALVEHAITELASAGHTSTRLPVAGAFHSPVIAGACGRFAEVLSSYTVRDLAAPVWSNRTASVYPRQAGGVRDELAAQIGAPVRFAEQIESMYAAGARVFVEAGPGQVLTGLVGAILKDRPHVAVACDAPAMPGLPGFLTAVAKLAVAGVRLRTGWLFSGRDAVDVSDTTPPPQPGWTVDGHLIRTTDGSFLPGGLAPARQVQVAPTMPISSDGDALISEFLRTSREMVAAQRDVLLTYLGAESGERPAAPKSVPPPISRRALSITEPVAALAAPAPTRTSTPAPKDNLTDVLEIISQRTGYPIDMIEPGLDLEADLSIDSIKRTEILGALAARLGERADATKLTDPEMEELAKARTAGALAGWLDGRVGDSTPPPLVGSLTPPNSDGVAPTRFVIEPSPLSGGDPLDGAVLRGRRFVIVGGDSGVGEELAAQLSRHGAAPRDGDLDEPLDGLIWLDALTAEDDPLLPEAFPIFQAALVHRPRWLLAACSIEGGTQAAGLRGFFRTVAKEYPDVRATLVEVDPAGSPTVIAHQLLGELTGSEHFPVVRHAGGARHTLGMVEAPLPVNLSRTSTAASVIGLNRSSVVLLLGGARGITARFAVSLARASGCRIELAGRTPLLAGPEDPATAAAVDRPALRAALAALGHRSPADVERAAGQILAQRQVVATLAELRTVGAAVRYHSVDTREPHAVRRLVKDVHTEHGRIDGVIYAAGVIEDKLLAGKDLESFRRVFATKVDGARALLSTLEDLPGEPRFVVLFGSVAAVVGNPGQADYAAANDALESLGASWATRTGHRALTVHWGPWAPSDRHGGMVTSELAHEYGRRGIALINPAEGIRCLLDELAWGAPSTPAVVYTAPGWPT
ncbi:MAG: SDR family oxidoreductase [Pseudonocardiaceae bacterium]